MRWLNVKDDTGASAVLVALLMIVIFGFVGLAIDAAALFAERRELHNAADAAALAVAEDCGLGARPCDVPTAMATSDMYADANAKDGLAGIETLELDLSAQTIYVQTHTEEAAGGTEIDPFFMHLLGFDGTRVRADATAQWGVPSSLSGVLPLIVSHCEWEGNAGFTTTIFTHGGAQSAGVVDCNSHPGFDLDEDGRLTGGFGWLEAGNDCEMDIEVDHWYPNEPGAAVPHGCKHLLSVGNVVYIPFFYDDDGGVQGNGQGEYFIAGFGAFEILSYKLPGMSAQGSQGELPCTGSEFCVKGRFITDSTDLGDFGTGTNYGVVLVKLID